MQTPITRPVSAGQVNLRWVHTDKCVCVRACVCECFRSVSSLLLNFHFLSSYFLYCFSFSFSCFLDSWTSSRSSRSYFSMFRSLPDIYVHSSLIPYVLTAPTIPHVHISPTFFHVLTPPTCFLRLPHFPTILFPPQSPTFLSPFLPHVLIPIILPQHSPTFSFLPHFPPHIFHHTSDLFLPLEMIRKWGELWFNSTPEPLRLRLH